MTYPTVKHSKSITIYFILFLIITPLLNSCNSIERYNRNFDKKISPKKLKADVSYTQRKLTKLHPHLYDYISKESLDNKFDSLKNSINQPLTKTEFFYKLSPIIASIKQGHTRLYPPTKKIQPELHHYFEKNGPSPLSDFKFGIFNEHIYITKNKSIDSTILLGTEIVAINQINSTEIIKKHRNTFGSDGTNQTFKNRMIESYFDYVTYYQFGNKDSLSLTLNYKDSIYYKTIKREYDLANFKKKVKSKPVTTESFLTFPTKDSSNVALVTVKGFEKENYKYIFDILEYTKSKNLIIDLRGNLGGNLKYSNKLYTYLIKEKQPFLDSIEMNSRFSILHSNHFKNKKIVGKLIHIIRLPAIILSNILFIVLKTEHKNGKNYYKTHDAIALPKENSYSGNIYVITNGTTFSAASIEASILKENKKATIVGEETGGSAIGTVAGRLPTFRLPHSDIKLNFGLMYIKHFSKNVNTGTGGVIPDIEIIPTLNDRINKVDPELEWILNEIKKNMPKTELKEN